jgi:hypothetical protein
VFGPDKEVGGQDYMPVRTPARPPNVPESSGQGETHGGHADDEDDKAE